MTLEPSTKARVLADLKARGVSKAVLDYNGGNDEGGVDGITFYMVDSDVPVDFPIQWEGTGDDKELARLLEGPVDSKYGSWAGEFSAYGTLTWDVGANTVVMDDHVQDEYRDEREEW